jgi:protein dithiol:quinone oxidoreductase
MKRLFRIEQIVLALLTMLALLVSFYLQYVKNLEPCPLCLMQRFMMFGILFFALIGMLKFTRRRACVLACFELLFAAGGIFFATRQLWLQSLPVAETGMCLPGIESLMDKLPWQDVVHAFIWGSSTGCGEVDWTFAGFSMPAWSVVYFGLIGLMSLFFLIGLCKHDRISH